MSIRIGELEASGPLGIAILFTILAGFLFFGSGFIRSILGPDLYGSISGLLFGMFIIFTAIAVISWLMVFNK